MTGVAMNTIQKLLADLGMACTEYQDKAMRNLNCKHIQCDEIWQFCYAKDKNVPADKRGTFGYGDVWTWVALDADDYVARAVRHAGDLHRLAALRGRLRQQVLASPLFDAPRFARNFEAALRGMWQAWCAAQRASSA